MHYRDLARSVVLMSVASLAGCSSNASPTTPAATFVSNNVTAREAVPTIYTFVPNLPPHIAEYQAEPGTRSPQTLISGEMARLTIGDVGSGSALGYGGVAVDTDGTLYVLVSSQRGTHLLTFAPGASGNVAPEHSLKLNVQGALSLVEGLAIDHHGNFWVASDDNGGFFRFPLGGTGLVSPNLTLSPVVASPWGVRSGRGCNVATDTQGKVYAECVVFKNNLFDSFPGVSEYSISPSGDKRLLRTFYDTRLKGFLTEFMAVAPDGTIYLSGSSFGTGVFAYPGTTGSGAQTYSRRFDGLTDGSYISAVATDDGGNVYVASESRILVFGPKANGEFQPPRYVITDPLYLSYRYDSGTLLSVH